MTALIRFVLLGITNTLLTGLLFFLLLFVMPAWVAYSIAFACGILFASYATPLIAFRVQASVGQRVTFAAWYLAVYVTGLGLIRFLQSALLAGRLETAILTVGTTATLGFAGARVIFGRPSEGEEP